MKTYILKRLLLIIPTLFGITIITFIMIQLMPGDPAMMKLKNQEGMSSSVEAMKVIEETRKLYGLDKPLYIQYINWLKRILTFDFGRSFKDHRLVIEKIGERLPITLQINILTLIIVYIISIPLGVFSSTHQDSTADKIITIILFILYSLPSFWVATLLIMFFGGGSFLNLFPIYGMNSEGAEAFSKIHFFIDRLWHLVLPIVSLTYGSFAFLSRITRAGMLEVLRQDYIRTARAKGLKEKTVIFKHAFRNSLIPLVTLFATLLPFLISGSIIIENIFSIPGMGKLTFEALLSRDRPVYLSLITISSFLTLAGILLADILYAIVDPRISYEE